ncbi:unnamed protein product [Sphagnum troendelagicum]|uniref:Lysine ketoglutarate reductase trans-splicing-like protein n=1 Tax=Sphagnum troendelagicum TaxID=128251 RepID=A0ABP0TUE3_9BRYO
MVPAFFGMLLGIAIGVSFMRFGAMSNMNVFLNQQQLADAKVGPPEQVAVKDADACLEARPLGTESIPQDIIAPQSDLYPRRLWGKPEEDLQHKPKYLLTLTVGLKQKGFVNQCVKKFSKEWQILLFHYDGHVNEWDDLEWSASAIHVSTHRQAKWWYAKRFLHPDIVDPYEYIFIWDEDLDVEHFDAEKYMELIKRHGLEISQPGLDPSQGLTWQMTKRLGNSEVHKETVEQPGWCPDPHNPPCAGFVEIMAPVFSRKAWRCIWYIIQNDLVHGWGLDFSLRRCVQMAHEKIGVVDAQWVRHRVIPSLGEQGESDTSNPVGQAVRDRCKYEWGLYTERWKLADEKQKLENEAKENGKI